MMKIEGSGSTPKCHGSATLLRSHKKTVNAKKYLHRYAYVTEQAKKYTR
jgi:hypothetical protein